MKNEEEKLEELILEKSFGQLNVAERHFVVSKMGSEEEYTAMRKMETLLRDRMRAPGVQPKSRGLNSLKEKMRAIHAQESLWRKIVAFKIPAYTAVLVILVVVWLMKTTTPAAPLANPMTAVIRTDTVYRIKIDTVYKARTVYRYVTANLQTVPKETHADKPNEKPKAFEVGVSMKDKEELDKLLVSGSDR